MNLRLRPATAADVEALIAIHYDGVHTTAAPFYPSDVLDAWSPAPNDLRYQRLGQEIADDGIVTLVAELGPDIAGFGMVVPHHQELRAVYVHPAFGRRGVGAAILGDLEQAAVERGIDRLNLDASTNAEAFYAHHGYAVVERTIHRFQSGHEMACVKMGKALTPAISLRVEIPRGKL